VADKPVASQLRRYPKILVLLVAVADHSSRREYNFVGPPNSSKLTWTDELMKRVDVGGEESGSSTSSPTANANANAMLPLRIYTLFIIVIRRKKMYFFSVQNWKTGKDGKEICAAANFPFGARRPAPARDGC
jgi:hypothetical protein